MHSPGNVQSLYFVMKDEDSLEEIPEKNNETTHNEDKNDIPPVEISQSYEKFSQRTLHALIHPFLSGLFGSIASLFAKHTFSSDFGGWGPELQGIIQGRNYVEFGIRLILFIITLYLNGFMLKFFINSLKRNGATVAKVLSLSISFFMNGLISLIYFKEPLEAAWGIGLFLIMIGIYFLTKDKVKQDRFKKKSLKVEANLVSQEKSNAKSDGSQHIP